MMSDIANQFGSVSIPGLGDLDAKPSVGLGMNIAAFVMNVISIIVAIVMICKKEPKPVPFYAVAGASYAPQVNVYVH
jgi:hypothetical protein